MNELSIDKLKDEISNIKNEYNENQKIIDELGNNDNVINYLNALKKEKEIKVKLEQMEQSLQEKEMENCNHIYLLDHINVFLHH